jgi:tetratricopeptide (TPR) repeat protein
MAKTIIYLSFILFNLQPIISGAADTTLFRQLVDGVHLVEKSDFNAGLQMLQEVKETAADKKDFETLVLAQLNIGALYYRLSDNEKALNNYFIALDLANQHQQHKLLNSIYNNLGIIYSTAKNTVEAERYFNQAIEISRQLNDTLKTGINLMNLGNFELDQSNFEAALKYLNEANIIFEKMKNVRNLAEISSLKGVICFKQKDFGQSKALQLRSFKLMETSGDNLYLTNYTYRLGNVYLHLDQLDSSLYYFEMSLKLSQASGNSETQILNAEGLAEVYRQKKQLGQSAEYYQMALVCKDSLLNKRNQKWISEMQMKYEFDKQADEIDFLIPRSHWYLAIWVLSIIILALIAFFMWYGLRSRHQRAEQRNIILQKEKELQLLEIQKAEAENKCLAEEIKSNEERNTLKQEHLRAELEHKNRELALNALHIINKNEILSEIKSKLSDAKKSRHEDLSTQVRSIIHSIDADSNLDKEWESFKLHFEYVHGDFFVRIQNDYPQLNQSDLRLCAYLFINLNNKEIARILNIAPDSMRKRKQRLREKLAVETENEIIGLLNRYR